MKPFFGAFLFVLVAASAMAQAANPSTVGQTPAAETIRRPPQTVAAAQLPAVASDACVSGFVWREAFAGDRVCVDPAVRSQAAIDNRVAARRRAPGGGPYGADTCRQGYVWREARPTDRVCVLPQTRTQAANDNRAAAGRVARSRMRELVDVRLLDRVTVTAEGTLVPPMLQPPPPRPAGGGNSVTRGFDENGDPYIDEKLADGSTRREQRKGVTIIKPDGTSTFYPTMVAYSNVQPPTPPDLPDDPALGLAWMNLHNERLFGLIGILVNNSQSELDKFTAAETRAVGADVFLQIEYRARILQFLATP